MEFLGIDYRVWYFIVAVVFFVFGLGVGGNNPEWVSQRARDMKKFVEDAKTKEGREQIIKDAIAEYERNRSKLGG